LGQPAFGGLHDGRSDAALPVSVDARF
jgi:hypothetical protein